MGRPIDARVIAAGVAVPLVAVAVIVAVSVRDTDDGPGPDPTVPASARPITVDPTWNEDLARGLEPLTGVLGELASSVDAWSQGDLTDTEMESVLDRTEPVLGAVRTTVVGLDDHPDDPLAGPLVEHMAELYAASVSAHRHALGSTGGIRTQYDRLGRRLRILADRVFDRARERTSAPVDIGPNVSVVLPAEVPDWERLELAAGPPLEAEDPNRPDDLPLERATDRASQDEDAWMDDLAALDAPAVTAIRAALDDPERLGTLARRSIGAAEALRAIPVPDGDRGRADRVALGWLIRADAARAAQLDAIAATAGGRDLAVALLELSDSQAFDPG